MDFREFVFESEVEDFVEVDGSDIVVSTIHKAKGREFDDVYMMIADALDKDDNMMRRFYVGMTRAKKRLFIHTNMDFFENSNVDLYQTDRTIYNLPNEVVLQLSLKDVYLDYFKQIKSNVLALRGGDALILKNFVLYDCVNDMPVAKLSKKMAATLELWKEKGYQVKSAEVRFVVAWKAKDAPKGTQETAVLLADLNLCK